MPSPNLLPLPKKFGVGSAIDAGSIGPNRRHRGKLYRTRGVNVSEIERRPCVYLPVGPAVSTYTVP
jgi:hypothetical protein